VTKDEIPNPNNLDLWITVNNEMRQKSNTKYLIYDIERCIEFFSSFYTLLPGDIIMSGTPEGVGPVKNGDLMIAEVEKVGRMEVRVRNA
jgi:2-keto-4-pentenoate hydratase/2-oxohepta-3-ene-1,7-dioic acid hydratase in catechol pathway